MINQELVDKKYGEMKYRLVTPADVVKEYPMFKKFFKWLNFHANTTVCLRREMLSLPNRYRILLYTDQHSYAIDVAGDAKHKNPYIGCVYSCRKHEPLEDWTRGNDLADGYDDDMLTTILLQILEVELIGMTIDGYTPTNTHSGEAFKEDDEK